MITRSLAHLHNSHYKSSTSAFKTDDEYAKACSKWACDLASTMGERRTSHSIYVHEVEAHIAGIRKKWGPVGRYFTCEQTEANVKQLKTRLRTRGTYHSLGHDHAGG